MHVIFVEPNFPSNQRQFVRGLHRAGTVITGIGERPIEYLDDEMRRWLHAYEQVPSVCSEPALLDAVQRIQKRGWVDRLEGTVESHMLPIAKVRERCGIPGLSVRTTYLCRDKPSMKEVLREAGVSTAQSDGIASAKELAAFGAKVGYPLIVKPRDAAGASGTYKVAGPEDVDRVATESGLDRGAPAAVEEFIEGHEGFYDAIVRDGEVLHEFATHYYPNVLEAMRHRWITPVFITTNRLHESGYEEVRKMGRKVIEVLGITTSATHMEWFYGPKGLKFSEIGCRPAGVGAWDVYSAANDFDIYAEWARAIIGVPAREVPSRRYAAAMVSLRPTQDGTITGYSGIDDFHRFYSDCIVDTHFPGPGTATMPVEAGYMANAWMRLRHTDYDSLREIIRWVGQNVRMHAN